MSVKSINTKPKNSEEMTESLEAIRGQLATVEGLSHQFEAAAADIEAARGAVKEAAEAAIRAKNAEEIAKAAQEATRGGRDDESIEKQLRNLPKVHAVAKDKDWSGKVEASAFNVLAMSRRELEMYLDGAALAWAKRYRRLNDAILTADTIMRAQGDAARRAYNRAGGVKSLSFYGAFEEAVKLGQRALANATAGSGAEWDPTLYSSERLDDVKDMLEIAGIFQSLPMPHSPWAPPFMSGSMTAYVHAEAASDTEASNTAIAGSSPTTSAPVFTAKTLAAMGYWSREADQESITPLIPVFDQELAYAIAYGWDNGVVNGQLSGTIDTGDDPATTNPRDHYNGLRWAAKQTGKQVDFGGTLTVESIAAMIGKAGKYANLASGHFITGYSGLARLLVLKDSSGNVLNLTRDKAGEAATLFGGTVGVLLGYPLTIGGVFPQNMDATGIIPVAASTKTGMLFVNKAMYRTGTRQNMTVEVSDQFRFDTDQRAIKGTARVAFQSLKTPAAASPFVVEGVNIPAY